MTYSIELLNDTIKAKIQQDLRIQEIYKHYQVENIIWRTPNERWAFDIQRNRYLHRVVQAAPPTQDSYHFHLDGKTYQIVVQTGAEHNALIFHGHQPIDSLSARKLLPEIQEAFDIYGRYGSGTDDDGWPGANRVELTLKPKVADHGI